MFELKNQFGEIVINPEGGTILSWKIQANGSFLETTDQSRMKVATNDNLQEILYQGSSFNRTGIPILFPFANPLKDNIFLKSGKKIKQHGFARNCIWKLTEKSQNSITLTLSDNDLSSEIKLAYPYEFELSIKLSLDKNVLNYDLIVTNKSEGVLPISPGLHPYFPIEHSLKKQLQIDGLPLFKNEHFDWDQKLNGDFFDFNGSIFINFPNDKKLQIQEISKQKSFGYMVIWSQTPQEEDFDFVCIEPFTKQTNAINNDPILVLPNETWQASIKFTVS